MAEDTSLAAGTQRLKMRVLAISNLYPPHVLGGYEIAASEVVSGLLGAGHEVVVLTSNGLGEAHPQRTPRLHRLLRLTYPFDRDPPRLRAQMGRELWNLMVLRLLRLVMRPDIVLAFNIGHLGGLLADELSRTHRATAVFDIFDPTLLDDRHQGGAWFDHVAPRLTTTLREPTRRVIGRFLPVKRSPVDLDHSYVRSGWLQQEFARHRPGERLLPVLHHGLPASFFLPDGPLRSTSADVLYFGRLSPEKGIEVLLRALPFAARRVGHGVSVTIAGRSSFPGYEADLDRTIATMDPSVTIRRIPMVPRAEVPNLIRAHSVCVVPSLWEEPFGLAPLEAMAAGAPLVCTGTGGMRDYAVGGRNCLVVEPGNVEGLADAVATILSSPELGSELAAAGQEDAERFTLPNAAERIENHLVNVLAASRKDRG